MKKKSLKCSVPMGWRFLLLPDLVSRACWHWLWHWGFLITSFQQFQSLPRSSSLCLPLYPSTWAVSVMWFCYSLAAYSVRSSSVSEKMHCVFICVRDGEENVHHIQYKPIHVVVFAFSLPFSGCQCYDVLLLVVGVRGRGVSWQQPSLI